MRIATLLTAAVILGAFGLAGGAVHADGLREIQASCASCHQIEGPAKKGLEARINRKAPALFYAGNKFRKQWLVRWLQAPTRIRPAGDFPPKHVKSTPDGDVIDPQTFIEHPVLDAKTARAVADWLMSLRPHDDLIAAEDYAPGPINKRMGAMNFVKFKGCAACHKDTPKYGGLSGPELYTAWQRLQPEYIVSYIRDPLAWEPASLMPVKHLDTEQIHKLVDYLKLVGEEKQ